MNQKPNVELKVGAIRYDKEGKFEWNGEEWVRQLSTDSLEELYRFILERLDALEKEVFL